MIEIQIEYGKHDRPNDRRDREQKKMRKNNFYMSCNEWLPHSIEINA